MANAVIALKLSHVNLQGVPSFSSDYSLSQTEYNIETTRNYLSEVSVKATYITSVILQANLTCLIIFKYLEIPS